MIYFRKILSKSILILWDFITVLCAVSLSTLLLYPDFPANNELVLMLVSFAVFVFSGIICRSYSLIWRHVGMLDCIRVIISSTLTTAIMALLRWLVFDNIFDLPAGYFLEFFLVILTFALAGRCTVKLVLTLISMFKNRFNKKSIKKKVIIYGAGAAGCFFLEKLNADDDEYYATAFIDDDKMTHNQRISNVKVYGGIENLSELIDKTGSKGVIVAIPTISPDKLEMVMNICKSKNIFVKRFANLDDASNLRHAQIHDVNIEDLLHRDPIKLDMDVVENFVKGKTVMVTGGVGSIGSEICRQALKFGCEKLVVFDFNENGLFFIGNELNEKGYEGRFELRLGSIRDRKRLDEVFCEFKPSIVFHAAAHKHVPMMEINPVEAVKNNVFGTINVCQEAILHKIEKFILISTDKAVNPTNIMGATKRIAELVIQLFDAQSKDTDFAAVRFGNVLGSNGSVVPFFKNQISKGGPVTVTHPDMRRYFMTIPEACQLVLEAGAMAKGGEIFVLDMGEPVKIYDLACDLIRLSGLVPEKDIKIVFTGLRPGEKLFEEISMADEDVDRTSNKKIVIMKPVNFDRDEVAFLIKNMGELTTVEEKEKLFDSVQKLVPTFKHNK